MNITCPHCQFSQDVPADRLPAVAPGKSILATCPRCSSRFRLFPHEGTTQLLDPDAVPAARPRQETPDYGADAGHTTEEQAPETRPITQETTDEEEDPRMTASRAYAREAERGRRLREASQRKESDAKERADDTEDNDEQSPLRNPWEEAPRGVGYVEGFYQTVLRIMFGAPRFFAGLRDDAPPLRALIFFLIVGVIGVTAINVWGSILRDMLASTADPQLQAMADKMPPERSILFFGLAQLFALVMQLYIVSGLMFLSFRLSTCRSATYARVFQIVAYSSAPMLLCIVPVLGNLAGLIWCLASIVIGCRAAFRLSWAQTLVGCLPTALLLAMLFQQTLAVLSSF